jgi:hypothetical protein
MENAFDCLWSPDGAKIAATSLWTRRNDENIEEKLMSISGIEP